MINTDRVHEGIIDDIKLFTKRFPRTKKSAFSLESHEIVDNKYFYISQNFQKIFEG